MAEPISAACGAWDDLWGAGFPDPVLDDTGNGTHLLYPVDLPNDSDKYALAKRPTRSSLFSAVSVSAVCAIAWRSNARIWAPCSKSSSALGGVRHNVPLIPHTQLLLRFGRFHWLFLHIGMVDVVF